MPYLRAADIVQNAMMLRVAHPDWTALQVLDLAAGPVHGQRIAFRSDDPDIPDLLDYGSSFAQLLREAFDPEFEDSEALIVLASDSSGVLAPRTDAALRRWRRVIDRFAAQYNLQLLD